jgi:hypothetical protein
MQNRHLSEFQDKRLDARANRILDDLFHKGCHSIRQFSQSDAGAKGCYRFLNNERVSEADITARLAANCKTAAAGKLVVCIQDTTQINLSTHVGRLQPGDGRLGATNNKDSNDLGFFLHPGLVLDAIDATPYGYAAIKIWNRDLAGKDKHERKYLRLPIEDKESYKWIEVSQAAKDVLTDTVEGMVIVQDREGDLYEQFATIPDERTALLIRASSNRRLADGKKLFDATAGQASQGSYSVQVTAQGKRKARMANIEIRYLPVVLIRPRTASGSLLKSLPLYLIEARETGYSGEDAICWRLLTTLDVPDIDTARTCIEWYSWRWTIEEVFRILKKEGFNIEASELERGGSVRKLSVLMMEVIIKLFLMRLAYAEPEINISADRCFNENELLFLEHQISALEGRTQKQKNPHAGNDLKRYAWAIARLGGWKGYESKRHPGITTLWIGLKYFYAAFQGWEIHRNVSTR